MGTRAPARLALEARPGNSEVFFLRCRGPLPWRREPDMCFRPPEAAEEQWPGLSNWQQLGLCICEGLQVTLTWPKLAYQCRWAELQQELPLELSGILPGQVYWLCRVWHASVTWMTTVSYLPVTRCKRRGLWSLFGFQEESYTASGQVSQSHRPLAELQNNDR